MADFDGGSYTAPNLSQGSPLGSGQTQSLPNASQGSIGGGGGSVTYYSLACFDNVGVRHYWTDTSVSMTNAPAGPTYVTATLTVEG